MAVPIRRISLSRRTFLRGTGAAIALPWLSAMTPALTREAADPVRTCFIFAPNGQDMDGWTPRGAGSAFSLSKTLLPLEELQKQVLVISGLGIDAGRAHGDGPGDHARAASTYLTCMHPKKTGAADIRVGISADQVIAQKIGAATRFPSLELGMERGRRAGVCDSGYSCAYSNNISWRSETTPVAKETRPREVYARLFGDPADIASKQDRQRRLSDRRSVLDLALEDTRRLRRQLGGNDRAKLDQYLESIRSFERRLRQSETERPVAEVPAGVLDPHRLGTFASRLDLMYDLIVLAFRADLTRTVTFMLGNAGSNRSYRAIGVTDGHHDLSHHGKKPHKLERIRRINLWHAERFARFLRRLDEAEEGSSDLLEQSMVLYGSGLGDGNRHDHLRLPVVLAGRGGGAVRSGRHLVVKPRTPMANLHLAVMAKAGVHLKSFADSNRVLAI
ncbi:MAG: hypothetical protein CMJ83_20490 [Planctomycetes bacterium]|nr:hypothetical protein [Planctomycetota bacterium]